MAVEFLEHPREEHYEEELPEPEMSDWVKQTVDSQMLKQTSTKERSRLSEVGSGVLSLHSTRSLLASRSLVVSA